MSISGDTLTYGTTERCWSLKVSEYVVTVVAGKQYTFSPTLLDVGHQEARWTIGNEGRIILRHSPVPDGLRVVFTVKQPCIRPHVLFSKLTVLCMPPDDMVWQDMKVLLPLFCELGVVGGRVSEDVSSGARGAPSRLKEVSGDSWSVHTCGRLKGGILQLWMGGLVAYPLGERSENLMGSLLGYPTAAGKSPSREVVRSSAGADAIYPLFFGVVRVAYPKACCWMSKPL